MVTGNDSRKVFSGAMVMNIIHKGKFKLVADIATF